MKAIEVTDTKCDLLDDYLDGYLSTEELDSFEQHAASCAECREVIRLQHSLEGALRGYAETLEPLQTMAVPVPLPARTLRKKAFAFALIATSVLVALATWRTLDRSRTAPKVVNHPSGDSASDSSVAAVDESTGTRNSPQFLSIDAPDYLVVVEPQADDGLTFVMLYPKINRSD